MQCEHLAISSLVMPGRGLRVSSWHSTLVLSAGGGRGGSAPSSTGLDYPVGGGGVFSELLCSAHPIKLRGHATCARTFSANGSMPANLP